jgi:hypothetical protein
MHRHPIRAQSSLDASHYLEGFSINDIHLVAVFGRHIGATAVRQKADAARARAHGPHIVDYKGERSLVLLNVINRESGMYAKRHFVLAAAQRLGVRPARDVTHLWPVGTSIAQIYEEVNLLRTKDLPPAPGVFHNVEGFMAQYRDDDGREQMVKIKSRSYDDRKFMRDMKWEKLLAAFDFTLRDVPLSKRIQMLWYNVSNPAVRRMLEERIAWIRDTYEGVISQAEKLVAEPLRVAMEYIAAHTSDGEVVNMREGLRSANAMLVKSLQANYGEVSKELISSHMGFIRSALSGKGTPADAIHRYAIRHTESVIARETEKRGTCAFWVTP